MGHNDSWMDSNQGDFMARFNQNGKKKLSIKEKQDKKKEKMKRKLNEQKTE
jgi:hypothetical protein